MLRQYRSDYEKITMGLLSLIPDLKDIHRLQEEMDWYQKDPATRQLFVCESDEDQQMIGVVGIEINQDFILLRHIAINPSYRNEGLSLKFIDSLNERYPDKKMMGTLDTAGIVTKWEQGKN
ncbi:GNAT family N-acetyltransferase [Isobaculum melis]|uniref:Riboflavin biosynthesis RibT protein n=1 Tax=Isobaculum melis TaxID=142588 RepID=A0A1H9R7C8_9LACT|nr:GNAT family N-acetyltransferase [Isobaculum melis]SER68608.1 riboflavin biosynthesis RibT protein [Isobaculum melis]